MSSHFRCDRCGTEMNRPAGTLRQVSKTETPLFASYSEPPMPHWDLCEECFTHMLHQIEPPT